MTINYSATDPNYISDRYALLKLFEKETTYVYPDTAGGSVGWATIGTGFMVSANTQEILQNMGLTPAQIAEAAPAITNLTKNNKFATRQAALDALNFALRESTGDMSLNFAYADTQQVIQTFNDIAYKYDRVVDGWLNGDPLNFTPATPNDRERLVLYSLAYNGVIGFQMKNDGTYVTNADGSYKYKSPSLRNAILIGDRAAAWYEIRYQTNNAGWKEINQGLTNNELGGAGLAKRRYIESQMFGLYDNSTSASLIEAKNAFRMLQLHRADILKYEAKFGVNPDGTTDGRNMIAEANSATSLTSVDTLVLAFDPAKTALLADLNTDINPADYLSTDIYLDPGRGSASAAVDPNHVSTLTGSNRNDILIGEGGIDTLEGGAGNDVLVGGAGKDFLDGGLGNDTYIYKSGDGTDHITDASGLNAIYVGSTQLTGAPKDDYCFDRLNQKWSVNGGEYVYYFDEANKTLTISGSKLGGDADKIIIDNVSTLSEIKDRFGIDLSFVDYVVMTQDSKNPFEVFLNYIVPSALGDTMSESTTQNLNVGFNRPLTATDTITLCLDNCSIDPSFLKLAVGDQTLDFSSGNITLNATEGQSFLAMSLIEQGDITTNGSATFHAEINSTDAGGTATTTQSNVFTVNINDNGTFNVYYGADDPYINYADVKGFDTTTESHGGQGNDYLNAMYSTLNLRFYGDAGNDALQAGDGNDELYGGDGNDLLNGGIGNDRLEGGTGNDVMGGGEGDDVMLGGEGNDYMYGGGNFGSTVTIIRNVNDPSFTALSSINRPDFGGWLNTVDGYVVLENVGGCLLGEIPGTQLIADGGNNLMDGGAGDDNLWGANGVDTMLGGDGADSLLGFSNDDVLYGGDGNDILRGDVTEGDMSAVSLPGVTSLVYYALPQYHGNDYLDGGAGDDLLVGDGGNDTLMGGDGNDKLFGDNDKLAMQWQGDDYLDGGAGDDQLIGNGGNDTLFGGTGDDTLWGNEGDDYLDGEEGIDTLWGGDGNDTIYGGTGDDKLYGENGTNYLDGEDGNDTLNSGGPGSELFGGAGDDNLGAAGGGNYLDGEDGKDTLIAVDGGNTLIGGAGDDNLQAGGGNNYLDGGEGNNTLLATDGGNTLVAGAGDDTLKADGGGNYLDSGDGNNILQAGGGNNTLIGGSGNDTLSAAGGNNYLYGGAGDDTYAFDTGFGENHIVDTVETSTDAIYPVDAGVRSYENTVIFSYDFYGAPIYITLGSLKLDFGNGDILHIDGYDPYDPYGTCSISTFKFNDVTLSLQDILNLGGAVVDYTIGSGITGTAGDDNLQGTTARDHLYGLAGDDTLDGGAGADVMKGGEGNDTYIVDNAGDQVVEQKDEGWDSVQSSVSYALGNYVEGLTLTGFDNLNGTGNALENDITGNDGNNILSGGEGNDTLRGGAGVDTLNGGWGDDTLDGGTGADVMAGGAGNDSYIVDNTGDQLTENLNAGTDLVYSSITYTLGANLENLALQGPSTGSGQALDIDGTGNELDNVIGGNSGDNILRGEAGNDTLNGGGGADTLLGGTGDDTYYVDDIRTVVIENSNEGIDSVNTAINYTLTDNVENLTLNAQATTGTGNAQDNIITGTNGGVNYAINTNYVLSGMAGNDTLTGNYGDDTLDGGSAADVMNGGFGSDTYYVDNAGDQVIEDFVGRTYTYANGYGQNYTITIPDIETVNASISYTLGSNLENLNLTGLENINGTGNELDNVINGNDGNNVLIGNAGSDTLNGGAGADVMDGGLGSDTYYVDNAGDTIIDSGAGTDRVYSSVTYTLENNLEQLTLTGTANINGGGNELSNIINGNVGNNSLLGGAGNDLLDGGAGADVMDGGDGSDTYIVDNADDVAAEAIQDGYADNVLASADFTLGANIENLELTGDALIGTGNELDNAIYGNDSDNVLNGLDGNDTLDGGVGNDNILGGNGDDYIYGGEDLYSNSRLLLLENSDTLDGGAGNDTIDGGSGNDLILGGSGDDNLFGGDDNNVEYSGTSLTNNDTIYGGDGNDVIDGGTGADRLFGGTGDDLIMGGKDSSKSLAYDPLTEALVPTAEDDYIDGGDGNDRIFGQSGNDVLLGGAGDDAIDGGDGDDQLDGGTGLDTLSGGAGDDVYVVDGNYVKTPDVPTLSDCGHIVLKEQLVWTSDTVTENADEGYDVVKSSGSYALTDNVEELRLTYDPNLATTDPQRYADLLAFGQVGIGNALDNLIVGDEIANRLEGGAGDDTLEGGAGNDTLVGGVGYDTLLGGEGDDRYIFRLGDGGDTIIDNQGSDTLRVGSGLRLADLEITREGDDLFVSVIGTSDTVSISNWFVQDEGVARIEFCNGTTLNRADINALFDVSPVANPDAVTVSEDIAQSTIAVAGLLSNDTTPVAGEVLSLMGFDAITMQGNAVSQNANGDLVFDIGNKYQSLAAGQTATDSFTYTITDTTGATSTATVNISINGVNDGPVTVNDAASVQEDGTLDAVGNVLGNDADIDQGTVLAVANAGTLQGKYGSLVLNADGSYSYALDNASLAVQSLAVGQIVTETFVYQATDGIASTPATLTVSITGSNDAAVAAGDAASVQEDTSIAASGNVLSNDSDVDQGTVLAVANAGVFAGQYGRLTLQADGNYTYALDNALLSVQSLAVGQSVSETFAYQATDGLVSTPSALTVTITGTNDAPVTTVDTAAVQEDLGITAAGNVLGNDSDVDQGTVLTVANAGVFTGKYGQLTLGVDGTYTYALNNNAPAVQSLAQGQTVADTFAYQATDGLLSTPSILTVTIKGSNDTPVVVADTATVQEDVTLSASGNVLSNDSDIDQGSVLTVANAGTLQGVYGSLVLNANGSYTYSLNNSASAVQSLVTGQTVIDSFTYVATDGIATTASTLAINIKGSDDGAVINGTCCKDILTGTGGDDTLNGLCGNDILYGLGGNDLLDGGAGSDTMVGGVGNDTYIVDSTCDIVTECSNEGIDTVKSSVSYTLGVNVENLALMGTCAINGTGNTLNNLVAGNSASNILNGGAGNDILQGGGGNDKLTDTVGNNLLDGGTGSDTLTGNTGKELYIGGLGNDTINTGNGANIIAFNKGDGKDTVNGVAGTGNTISLGGNFAFADLALHKSCNDLILDVGGADSITLKNWYAGTKNVVTLQVIEAAMTDFKHGSTDVLRNSNVETFNFQKMVTAFDQARAANPTLTSWGMTDALLTAHLSSSDTAALGGDLAYVYGSKGSLSGFNVTTAQSELSNAQFATAAQTLNPWPTLNTGTAQIG